MQQVPMITILHYHAFFQCNQCSCNVTKIQRRTFLRFKKRNVNTDKCSTIKNVRSVHKKKKKNHSNSKIIKSALTSLVNLMVSTEASWWNIAFASSAEFGWRCESETRVPSSRGLVKQYNQELCIYLINESCIGTWEILHIFMSLR